MDYEAKFKKSPKDFGMGYEVKEHSTKIPEYVFDPAVYKDFQRVHKNSSSKNTYLTIKNSEKFISWIKENDDVGDGRESSKKKDEDFTASKNIEHAMQILREATPEIIEQANKNIIKAKEEIKELVRAPYGVSRDVTGNYFDVGLHLTGEPESFYREDAEMIADKLLDVHVNLSYPCHVEVGQITKNIVNLAAAIKTLELSGHRVSVTTYWANEESGREDESLVVIYKIKEHRQPLNIIKLLGVSHPAFFRRLVFRCIELCIKNVTWGYGHSYFTMYSFPNVIQIETLDDSSVKEIIDQIKQKQHGNSNTSD